MASPASSARDIPTEVSSRDNLTVVAARNVPGMMTRSQALPTPPNSISPALGPRGLKAQLQQAQAAKIAAAAAAAAVAPVVATTTTPLDPVDSDLDLHEAGNATDDGDGSSSAGSDSAGAITSTLLAKHHLPDILLDQGPVAIRHIMSCLATSVPGFAAIPPTKARRLVVAALEGRGGDGGGRDGDVEFEKVGWGRWNARLRGHPHLRIGRRRSPPPERAGLPYASALPIPRGGRSGAGAAGGRADRSRMRPSPSSGGGDSIVLSFDSREHDYHPRHHVTECETDRMSLDGSASASCSEAPDDYDVDMMNDDPEDATDDEDWAAMGAAALRAASYPNSSATPVTDGTGLSRVYSPFAFRSTSAGMVRPPVVNLDCSALENSDAQERAAIEALMSLGSVET